MKCGVELFSDSLDGLNIHLVQLCDQLSVDHIHSAHIRIVLLILGDGCKSSFEVIYNREDLLKHRSCSHVEGLCLLLLGTVSEILELGELTLCPVFELSYLGFKGFLFLVCLLRFLLGLSLRPGFLLLSGFGFSLFGNFLCLCLIPGFFSLCLSFCSSFFSLLPVYPGIFFGDLFFRYLFGHGLSGFLIDDLVSIFFTHYPQQILSLLVLSLFLVQIVQTAP